MQQHLYLSLVPEAFIASMLEPEDFGAYERACRKENHYSWWRSANI